MIFVSTSGFKNKKISEIIEILAVNKFKNIELSGGSTYYEGIEEDLIKLKVKYNLELQLHNYIPILAHPERYRFLFNNFKEFYKLKKHGCLFQLNMFSLVGYYGDDTAKMANKLINSNLIDCVGTDIHNYKQLENFDLKITVNNDIKEMNKIFENDLNLR